jgi:hypothetical protein
LKKIIENQRILVIGSGPSASELKNIPEDIKIFTCNAGPRLIYKNKLKREINQVVYFLVCELPYGCSKIAYGVLLFLWEKWIFLNYFSLYYSIITVVIFSYFLKITQLAKSTACQ